MCVWPVFHVASVVHDAGKFVLTRGLDLPLAVARADSTTRLATDRFCASERLWSTQINEHLKCIYLFRRYKYV
jgi:hypothetical protein